MLCLPLSTWDFGPSERLHCFLQPPNHKVKWSKKFEELKVEKTKESKKHSFLLCISFVFFLSEVEMITWYHDSFYNFIKIMASIHAPELMTHLRLPSSLPTPNAGIDSSVLWGAWWIICGQKVLQEGGQFWDKSNKMVKSTASWTIYLSGTEISSFSLILYCSTLATSLVKAHSSPCFIETLIQFLKLSLSKDCVQ